ncbi:BRO-N domain-containing protein [Laribacter hongkongensis]|uniref:Antirepressor n=1 Tax=Laribacter hongkongensis TaxID=168471 RepID=A0A248LGT9_9NEIS|nr:Bro-N domain-containing protein [Laribacter hongkongensis]ASJ23711.1 antirepressor [Laribacter hongkongensis]MCG9042361.1 Bro-N domain-containing protein [Laribacter hongkongensis]MCG9069309.1 Bro-N domain-containing protein [Laribacter hongkongensis]MCG9089122.1 Bro-N domain-containing protein [Laribacter hongkongensis]MCG9111034.1 Bro-N domain-containing protein [Laribacter hongkongensis]
MSARPIQSVVPFQFESHAVRTIQHDGEVWFVASDVAAALEYSEASAMTRHLDDDEKGSVDLTDRGQEQSFITINESGLYSAILRSRKPEARRFKKWVTSEVLPAIRKTGCYSAPGAQAATPVPSHDCISAILLIGEAVAKVPGVKPGIAAAATLACIQANTGINTEVLRHMLPSANEPVCTLNATQLGKRLNRSAKATNQMLATAGLQFRNDRDEWELTKAGEAWAEAVPYSRNGHSGYQILWNPAVIGQLQEVA